PQRRPRLPDHGRDATADRPVRRADHQRQKRTDRSVVLRQGPSARRQHPGPLVPRRAPAVGLRCRTRLGPRPDSSPRPRPGRPVRRGGPGTSHPGRRRLRRRRNRRPHAHQKPRRRPDPQHRQPHLQPPPPRPALPRRTRVRPAQRPLAHPPAHHRQPQQNRRHHPRRTRPHSFRARPPTRNSVRSTQCISTYKRGKGHRSKVRVGSVTGYVWSLEYDRDNGTVFSGTDNGLVQAWTVDDGRLDDMTFVGRVMSVFGFLRDQVVVAMTARRNWVAWGQKNGDGEIYQRTDGNWEVYSKA